MQLERFSDAKSGLTACLEREPRQAWLFLLRGFSSYQLAVRARATIARLPQDEQALRTEAKLQLDAAAEDYDRAFKLLDTEAASELRYPLLVNRGVLELEREEFGPAEADLRAAIDLDGSRLEAYPALRRFIGNRASPTRPSTSSAERSRCGRAGQHFIAHELTCS